MFVFFVDWENLIFLSMLSSLDIMIENTAKAPVVYLLVLQLVLLFQGMRGSAMVDAFRGKTSSKKNI